MRSRYRVLELEQAHFITATAVAWLPIFTTSARCDILVNAFEYCRQYKELKLYAWVILDTHVHAIVAAPELTRVCADLKRHTADASSSNSKPNTAIGSCASYVISARRTNSRASIKCGRKDHIRRRS
jgi:REP element-mobilizing transposase RayT